MQQSNIYVIFYTLAITVVCGFILSFTSLGLKDRQKANVELERKKNVLSAAIKIPETAKEIENIYSTRVDEYVIDAKGEKQDMPAKAINVEKEYKKDPDERLLPVYEIKNESGEATDAYVFPLYGFGLWDNIWGFVALQSDLNTIQGINFGHKAETPGLGARITTDEISSRFKGKKIYEDGKLVSVSMIKGEHGGGDASIAYWEGEPHKVDGMSGATITGDGVNAMLQNYLSLYKPYIESRKSNNKTASL